MQSTMASGTLFGVGVAEWKVKEARLLGWLAGKPRQDRRSQHRQLELGAKKFSCEIMGTGNKYTLLSMVAAGVFRCWGLECAEEQTVVACFGDTDTERANNNNERCKRQALSMASMPGEG